MRTRGGLQPEPATARNNARYNCPYNCTGVDQNTKLLMSMYNMEIIIIIILEIFKAPTLRLKALNKHSITHIMYIEMENVISSNNY